MRKDAGVSRFRPDVADRWLLQGQIATLHPGIVMITFGSAEQASTRWPPI
jgi:hypothetical protein